MDRVLNQLPMNAAPAAAAWAVAMPLPEAGQARDAAALAARLRPLSALLREGDMAATDLFAELMDVHETAWHEALKPLADAMTMLNFPAAVLHCETLAETLALVPTAGGADVS
jgi:hypothetical protein